MYKYSSIVRGTAKPQPTIPFFIMFVWLIISCDPKLEQVSNQKPNIVILLADDAGFADFGFNGSRDIKTPNLDKLAKNGVVFTDAHVSASVCGPSRAGLITGRYQQRFGFECNPNSNFPGLPDDEKTVASLLKEKGYTTAAFGKWHLGDEEDDKPNQRGFDYYWGFLSGGRSYFPNSTGDKPGHIQSIRENDEHTTFDGYLTDVLGEKAAEFIALNNDKPFFIYWAPNAPHTPMEANAEDLARFDGHPRQTYAAMMFALDRAVGRIISELENQQLLENTLIFFLSDNGGAHNNQSSNLPLKGFKGNKYEGGHRVVFLVYWPEKIKEGSRFGGLTSAFDIGATTLDLAGVGPNIDKPLDGVSLIPFLTGEQTGNPHDQLFWRKDRMAAARIGSHKLIRVDSLGSRLYDLTNDLDEDEDLSVTYLDKLDAMTDSLETWENELMNPLWYESEDWNQVTWLIHQDLFANEEIRVKNPRQLRQIGSVSRDGLSDGNQDMKQTQNK